MLYFVPRARLRVKNVGRILPSKRIVVIPFSITFCMLCKQGTRSDRNKINMEGTSAAEGKKRKWRFGFWNIPMHVCACCVVIFLKRFRANRNFSTGVDVDSRLKEKCLSDGLTQAVRMCCVRETYFSACLVWCPVFFPLSLLYIF